jgi:hypothetical protein
MVELEAVELVFQLVYFLAVGLHLGIMAARGLHNLVDDEL